MKQSATLLILVTSLAALEIPCALGANSVVVESKTVAANAQNVTIGVYVTNDFELATLILPLELRSVTPGAFITDTFAFDVQGRVAASGLTTVSAKRFYGQPDAVNSCSGAASQSYTEGDSIPAGFFTSPDGVMWAGMDWGSSGSPGPLTAGSDGLPGNGTPSFVFTFDVTGVSGTFEIDTCCTLPANHLLFVEPLINQVVVPTFEKGVVSIACGCSNHGDPNSNGLAFEIGDAVLLMNILFFGAEAFPDASETCPVLPGDLDCNGVLDVLDLLRVIYIITGDFGPSPDFICDPCAP